MIAVADARSDVLRLDRLEVAYRRNGQLIPAVNGVDLAIHEGEAYGLVGESGCGKSTIALAAMAHLAESGRVVGGRILVEGQDIVGLPEPALRRLRGKAIAMVYQDPASALNPVLRIGRQLLEALRAHRQIAPSDARQEILEVLTRVRLPEPADLLARYPHQLSGGQLQRVVIAMALLARPRLLLLDEPTTGLDVTVEADVVRLIGELAQCYRIAVLYISHNLGLIARVCERVGVMYGGQLVEQGSVRQVLKTPQHPYTKALIACLPRLDGPVGVKRLPSIPGQVPAAGALPQGCIFHPRCRHAESGRCDMAPGPRLMPAAEGRLIRCLRAAEIVDSPAPAMAAQSRAQPRDVCLELDDVSKLYDRGGVLQRLGLAPRQGIRALDQVSFDVRRGEILALVGESGSGKTTLARILIGLEQASAGRGRYDGLEMTQLLAQRRPDRLIRALQIVFQNPDGTLNPAHSVGRILARAIRRLGRRDRSAVRTRVEGLLALVRLPAETADRFPQELSGGQRQRVAIARALAGEPGLVIADEPVSALDVSVQAAIVNLLVDVQDELGTAILFISHDLALVRHLADRVVVLYNGQVMECGTARAVFAPPFHPYTEALLAAAHPPDPDHRTLRLGPVQGAIDAQAKSRSPASTGCPFTPRCHRRIDSLCWHSPPPQREGPGGHRIRCHHELPDLEIPPATTAASISEKRLNDA